MNINRHNYEEYFILYMDNELGSDDRRMVEAFVQQHPDLKEELDLLLQYKLTPDTAITFQGKDELMKVNGSTPITLTNYEEYLVLYIDNELAADQRKEVEQLIAAHPSIEKELALLQLSKLQPEEIIFTDKGSLYRKEEKVRRLPIWWRAVAAALILALGLTAVLVFNKKPAAVEPGLAKTTVKPEKKITTPENIIIPEKKEDNIIPKENNSTIQEIAVENKKPSSPDAVKQNEKNDSKNMAVKNNNKPTIVEKIPTNIPTPLKKEDEAVAKSNDKPSNNLPQPLNNPNINKTDAAQKDVATANPAKETNISTPLTKDDVTNVKQASYNNSDGAADQLEEGGKNKKNRGFLRKLARTFEKRTNISATDEDRLLVGGLAIKLK